MSTLVLNQKREKLSLVERLQGLLSLLQLWSDRHYQRKQLAMLDVRQLRDIGLTPEQVAAEVAKPFWK